MQTDVHLLPGEDRQSEILKLIIQEGRITVPDICEVYHVSEATARRDLETLASQGRLRRVHGGAIALQKAPPESPILERSTQQDEEKQRIGNAAAVMVKDGETIFLGSGSTVLEMARNLRGFKNLTVLTNSLMVVNALASEEGVTQVVLGGLFRSSERSFIGHITEQALAEVRADRVFIGTRAVDVEAGFTNDFLPETVTDRAILATGREIVVLADHTKCGRISTAFLAPLESAQILITDQDTSTAFIEAVRARGIKVVVV
jgi:DeoR family transcriptional regulator, aga operon transcriptional repressor